MRVNCLAQEHNTMSLARAQTQTAQSAATHLTSMLQLLYQKNAQTLVSKCWFVTQERLL